MKSKLIYVLDWIRDHIFLLVSLTVKLVIGKKEETKDPTHLDSIEEESRKEISHDS